MNLRLDLRHRIALFYLDPTFFPVFPSGFWFLRSFLLYTFSGEFCLMNKIFTKISLIHIGTQWINDCRIKTGMNSRKKWYFGESVIKIKVFVVLVISFWCKNTRKLLSPFIRSIFKVTDIQMEVLKSYLSVKSWTKWKELDVFLFTFLNFQFVSE